MSRVLVANPPTYESPGKFLRPVRWPAWQYATPVMHPPIYLLSAATALRELGGHQVAFLDAQAPPLTVPTFLRRATALRPEVAVLETCLASFGQDARVAGELRRATGCRVVLCGPQLGVPEVAEEMMRRPEVDALVLGEYELSLLELVAGGLGAGIPGTVARDGAGRPVIAPTRPFLADLDSLPDPDQGWLDHRAYYDPLLRNPFAYFLAGRGCPHHCIFCSWPQTFTGRGYRARSAGRVGAEVARTLASRPYLRSFHFNDDTFTADRGHALAVAEELASRGVRTPWGCYARADLDNVELLRALRSAGCFLLKVGVESSDPGILGRAGKGYDIRRVEEAMRLMKRMGFRVHATFAFGLPGETPETVRSTIDWARRLDPHTVQFSVAVPYPGTAFHRLLRREGCLLPHQWMDLAAMTPVYRYPRLPPGELAGSLATAYRRFYLRPASALRLLGRLAVEPGRTLRLAARAVPFLLRGKGAA